jgi:hypothetical protein
MKRHAFNIPTLAITAAALAVGLLSGCGDDTAQAEPAEPGTVSISMRDFGYDDLPASVPAGTQITVTNASTTELHEFVVVRLADDDDRTAAEIVENDIESVLTSGPPTAVLIAPPGSDEQIPVVGDGTLADPGRYLVLCAIPTGADPDEYLAAAATSEGPPQVEGGPPHVPPSGLTFVRPGGGRTGHDPASAAPPRRPD